VASGSVIVYEGVRGRVWKVQFRDADRRQVKITLGKESDGWTRKRAEAALRQKLVEVEQHGWAQPESVTFAAYAAGWVDDHVGSRGLKTSTWLTYTSILETHLLRSFGRLKLTEVTVERIEQHLRRMRAEGLSPSTQHRHLAVLSLILGSARRKRLISENPIPLVERPKVPRKRWRILSPAEVGEIRQALGWMIEEATPGNHRDDLVVSRMMFEVLIQTALRRGEILGLRWKHVRLADPAGPTLRVEETHVRGQAETPKSEAGVRTIDLGPTLASALFDYRGQTPYAAESDRVFANWRTGNPFTPCRFASLMRDALTRAGVEGRMRPFHDLRHSSLTNQAVAGLSPEALMNRAGHSDFGTTRRYIDAGGVRFPNEADLVERRLAGEQVEREEV